MMKTIGAVLGGPTPRAAGHPVRRGSRLAGTLRGRVVAPYPAGRGAPRAAGRQALRAGRAAGRAEARPLGHVALEVLELLANLVSHRSGRLEPSITYLMGKLKRSKDAVVRALAALREHGFLDWLAGTRGGGAGGRAGPSRAPGEQRLPAEPARAGGEAPGALALLVPPLPDDVAQEREDRAAWLREHKAALPLSRAALGRGRGRPAGAGAGGAGARRRGQGPSCPGTGSWGRGLLLAGARVRQAGRNQTESLEESHDHAERQVSARGGGPRTRSLFPEPPSRGMKSRSPWPRKGGAMRRDRSHAQPQERHATRRAWRGPTPCGAKGAGYPAGETAGTGAGIEVPCSR